MFLGLSIGPLRWPAFALGSSQAGTLANMILATGVSVFSFKYAIGFMAVLVTLLLAGPLCFFQPQLKKTRIRAWLGYDRVAQEQLRQFEQKWIEHSRHDDMLGLQDFSAVIDLDSTVDKVHQMRRLPFTRNQLTELIVAALLPFLPVALLQIPIADLLALFKQIL